MKAVSIIGFGGVGMAHLCACIRSNCYIDQLIDTDQQKVEALSKARYWENSWGGVYEHVEARQCYVSDSFSVAGMPSPDLLIVAAPHTQQRRIIKDWFTFYGDAPKTVLLEKPPQRPAFELLQGWSKVVVGNQYTCSDAVAAAAATVESDPVTEIAFFCPTVIDAEWKRDFNVYDNLMPHVVGVLLKLGYRIEKGLQTPVFGSITGAWCNCTRDGHQYRISLKVAHACEHRLTITTSSGQIFKIEHDPVLFDRQLWDGLPAALYFEGIEAITRI